VAASLTQWYLVPCNELPHDAFGVALSCISA
jgi:hypothetical protein